MRKIACIVGLSFLAYGKLYGQDPYFNPEFYLLTQKNNITPIADFLFTEPEPICKSLKWLNLTGLLYVQRNTNWSEAAFGPSYIGRKAKFQAGIMLGFETEYSGLRIDPWLSYQNDSGTFQFNFYYETLANWNDQSKRGEIFRQIGRKTKLGYKWRIGARLNEDNIGPELNVKKDKIYYFLSSLYGWKENTFGLLFGLGAELK